MVKYSSVRALEAEKTTKTKLKVTYGTPCIYTLHVSPPRSVLHLTGGVTIAAAAQVPRPQLVGGAVVAASLGLTLVSWLAHSVRTRACSPSSKVSLVNILLQTYS